MLNETPLRVGAERGPHAFTPTPPRLSRALVGRTLFPDNAATRSAMAALRRTDAFAFPPPDGESTAENRERLHRAFLAIVRSGVVDPELFLDDPLRCASVRLSGP